MSRPIDRAQLSPIFAGLGFLLLASGCTSIGGFGNGFCVDKVSHLPSHCDCTSSTRGTVAMAIGPTITREYTAEGEPTGRTREFLEVLPVLLRGYWFRIFIVGRGAGAASGATWLRCERVVIPGQMVSLNDSSSPADHTQVFLAFFPLPPESERFNVRICEMHIAVNDGSGKRAQHHKKLVHAASALKEARSKNIPWAIADNIAPLDNATIIILPEPLPLLCKTTAEK